MLLRHKKNFDFAINIPATKSRPSAVRVGGCHASCATPVPLSRATSKPRACTCTCVHMHMLHMHMPHHAHAHRCTCSHQRLYGPCCGPASGAPTRVRACTSTCHCQTQQVFSAKKSEAKKKSEGTTYTITLASDERRSSSKGKGKEAGVATLHVDKSGTNYWLSDAACELMHVNFARCASVAQRARGVALVRTDARTRAIDVRAALSGLTGRAS